MILQLLVITERLPFVCFSVEEKFLIHFLFSFHQEFKVFLLCFAVLFAATSAATVCKCEEKKVQFILP